MQNNRKILVSVAGTRKTKYWPRTELFWSEFVDRLRIPVRSPETMEEYLAMPKAKQDELKDVGGFVGGTFAHDIRKAAYGKTGAPERFKMYCPEEWAVPVIGEKEYQYLLRISGGIEDED